MKTGRADPTNHATVNGTVAADFAQMGLTVEIDTQQQEAIEIMPVNHTSFDAFLSCETQWRIAATMAGLFWIGLDYPAARLVLDDLKAPDHVFSDIRIMEAEALSILNERAD